MIFNMQLSEDASLAELSDIRVGVDGTVYPSAGDAVRGQITDVKEDLDKLYYFEATPTWITGKFIRWDDGTINNNASYAYCMLNVTDEFAIKIYVYCPSGIMGIAFYDEDDNYISGYKNPVAGSTTINTVLGIPNGTKKIGITSTISYRLDAKFATFADSQIDKMSELINDIRDVLTYKEQVSYAILDGYFSTVNKIFNSGSGWSAALIPVSVGDEYYVTAVAGVGNSPLAFFYSGEPSAATFIASYGAINSKTTYTDIKIPIPSDAVYMGLNNYLADSPYMVVKKNTLGIDGSDEQLQNGKIAIKLSGDEIFIKPKKHDSQSDLMIVMGHTGGNSLFDFKSVQTIPNHDAIVSLAFAGGTSKFINPTDWLVSMKVRATTNIDGDNPTSGYFTGGNHRSTNTGSGGVVTAIENSLKFYADGNEIAASDGMYCDELRIEWNNSLQGYNTTKNDGTGRYILKQYYSLTIDRTGKMNITIRLVPLESIVLEQYFGFGWYGANGNTYYYKGSNTNRKKYIIGTDTVNSGDLFATEMVIQNDINMHCGVDNALDLGRLTHLGDRTYNYYNYLTKMYPMVVYEDVNMAQNENWYLGGYYYFE